MFGPAPDSTCTYIAIGEKLRRIQLAPASALSASPEADGTQTDVAGLCYGEAKYQVFSESPEG